MMPLCGAFYVPTVVTEEYEMSAVDPSTNNRHRKAAFRVVEPVPEKPGLSTIPWKKIAVYLICAAAIFLVGFIPMWVKAHQYAGEREAAQQELRLKQMENQLAEAVINAQRGEYEPARQTASDFFTSLRGQLDGGQKSDLSASQREKVRVLLSQRDEIITLLARSEPAAVERLSDIYVSYQKAMNDVEGGL
jgi:hypothetical protein